MARNKIEDLRNLLFAQIERLSDEDCDVDKEMGRAKAIAQIGTVLVNSIKAEVEFLKAMGADNCGSDFISLEPKKIKPYA